MRIRFREFNFTRKILVTFLLVGLSISSCKKFLETELNISEATGDVVFSSNENATNAMTGVYSLVRQYGLTGGGGNGITVLTGLSADELHNISQISTYAEFENVVLTPTSSNVSKLWQEGYSLIYAANSIIEGLQKSAGVTEQVKNQLEGEALFIRAYAYFYLVNLYGKLPLVLHTDYSHNAKLPRAETEHVYKQIVDDLLKAKSLMSASYPVGDRIRPNKYAPTAFLSRVYLFRGEWDKAALEATDVINSTYTLTSELDEVFLIESNETIWQLASDAPLNTADGAILVIRSIGLTNQSLTTSLLNAFESGDLRKQKWVGIFNDGLTDHSYAFKYKVSRSNQPITEYYVLLRLAEVYLIRAEANARLNNLEAAIEDVDLIRGRAELPLFQDVSPDISQPDLIDAIIHERRIELFAEGGHRWFDLKRTNKATDVLGPVKSNWTATDTLYPVPQTEFDRNPFLGDQNLGY